MELTVRGKDRVLAAFFAALGGVAALQLLAPMYTDVMTLSPVILFLPVGLGLWFVGESFYPYARWMLVGIGGVVVCSALAPLVFGSLQPGMLSASARAELHSPWLWVVQVGTACFWLVAIAAATSLLKAPKAT